MPTLSFIRPRAPRWISIVPSRNPFPAARDDNTSSLHPYASPDIIDIHDSSFTLQSNPDEAPLPRRPSPQPSPHLQIQLDLPSEPFDSDWFQTRFTSTPSPSRQVHSGPITARSTIGEGRTLAPASRVEPPQAVPEEVPTESDGESFDLSTSEDDVLGRLRAMDASTFLNLPPEMRLPAQLNQIVEEPTPPPTRRNPPTPIRIPSLPMHAPQVQIVRSAEANYSRPLSEISTAESSAVSGQTLARALLGNSFVLSTDARSSRYRSGFGGLVRSDSATLPRGDHPLMNSPYVRDRTLSGTSDTFAADSNAPPVPPNADKVYVPPQTHRYAGNELKKKTNVRRHSSTGSLPSPVSRGDSNYSTSRPNSVTEFTQDIDTQALRRISRISEAPSSSSTTPAKPDIPPQSPSPPPQSPPKAPSPQPTTTPSTNGPERPHTPPEKASVASTANGGSPTTSTALASPAKELDNVLEYYSEKPERSFAPAVSPIIEETSSQLSSPASKRLSAIGTPKSRTMSPLSGTTNGRMDLSTVRRPSEGALTNRASSFRRRSVQQTSPDSSSSFLTPPQSSQSVNVPGSSAANRSSLSPPRPLGSVVGGRLRSGSAPSPIKITRDSKDLNSYKIISPLPESALETPSTGESDGMATRQTFPETPNAFSPFWSGGSDASPGMNPKLPEGYEVASMPHTPRSAALPTQGRGIPPSLGQQVLLTRAASLMNHSRQANGSLRVSRDETKPLPEADDAAKEDDQVAHSPVSNPSEASPPSSASLYSEPSLEAPLAYRETNLSFASAEAAARARSTSPSTVGSSPMLEYVMRGDSPHYTTYSSSVSVTTLPSAHPSQSHLFGSAPEFTDPFDSQPHSSSLRYNQRTPGVSPHTYNRPIPTPPFVITPPGGESTSAPSPYIRPSLRRISEISHSLESPPPYDTIDHDRPPPISATPSTDSNNETQYSALGAQPSPPVSQESNGEPSTLGRKPSIGNRDRRVVRMRPTGPRRPLSHINNNHPQSHRTRQPSDASLRSITPNATPTPQIPAGQTSLTINPPLPNAQLEPYISNGLGTSMIKTMNIPSPRSPHFNVPDMPYRGLTMDQAKWTFTSAQLQTIVSRAIKQSLEASSIRLLRLETLDKEIPPELERLETRKTEIKAKYRSLTRSSGSLFSKLDSQITAGSSGAQGTLEELRDVTRQLNRLTEDLHSVDQQHAQIQNLTQVHSASALSMALRKLNASFMKELEETRDLRRQVRELEDEIWTLNELRSTKDNHLVQSQLQGSSADNNSSQLPQQPRTVPQASSQEDHSDHISWPANLANGIPEPERKKSAQIVTRRPSLRFSRSIRLSGNRLSQRSSLSSNGPRSSLGGMSGTNSTFDIPPVPPLPRRRPSNIVTDTLARSGAITSTDGGTPNTEVRAMIRAQDELYRMLGMTLGDGSGLRRSHSLINLPNNSETQPHSTIPSASLHAPTGVIPRISRTESLESSLPSSRTSRLNSRPLSYPASMLEAYNPMEADRKAMLATLEMISRDEH